MKSLFQPIPTSSSAPANGFDSILESTTEDYVIYRLLYVGEEDFREHFIV